MTDLPRLLSLFQTYLEKNTFPPVPAELYEPCDYIMSLGGKRLRPAMLLMAHELFDPRLGRAMPAAMAVEVFHNFSLVHDDIMDAAPLRRGQPTVHHRWDVNTGILSGDVMLVAAYDFLSKIRDRRAGWACFQVFNRTARAVCEGQQLDMDFERRDDVALAEYLKMIEMKTAALLAGAMEMGAIIGGASPEDARRLHEAGRLAGIAFQIQDDVLDTFGDTEKVGKQPGGDILQNKKTFLVLKFLETAPPLAARELRQWLATPTTEENALLKVTAVKNLFQTKLIREMAEEAKAAFSSEAFAHLEAVGVEKERKGILEETLAALIGRDR